MSTNESFRLERLPTVCQRRGDGRSSLYDAIAAGLWTPPVKMGRASAWPDYETTALIGARIAGADNEQMRVLVRDLLRKRQRFMPNIGADTAAPSAA